MSDVQITSLPAQLVLVTTRRVPMAEIGAAMGEAFLAIMDHASATGAVLTGPPMALYPEMPAEEVLFRVAMPVAPGAVAGEGVSLEEVPACEAATLVYRGPYDAMEPAWRQMMAWMGESGRHPGGPMREVYLNDPETVAPADLLTQLVVPLA